MSDVSAVAPPFISCSRCRLQSPLGTLVCPSCRQLIYGPELERIAATAYEIESTDPHAAAARWQQCLPLLPASSERFAMVGQRVAALTAGMPPPDLSGLNAVPAAEDPDADPQTLQYEPRTRMPKHDPLPAAIAKTIGSMVVSAIVYYYAAGMNSWPIAVGFVLLILVHEMGHVVALRYYGMNASPPIFIPFVGALINLRQRPRDAWQEAIIGIGGPVGGTVAALMCFAVALQLHAGHGPASVGPWTRGDLHEIFLLLSWFGFMLNLFNMLPVPPLDGGRVTAAVSPWAWIVGLLLMGSWVAYDFYRSRSVSWIMIVVLIYAFPRIRQTLASGGRSGPYYAIGRQQKWAMGAMYVGLTVLLLVAFIISRDMLRRLGIVVF